MPDSGCSQFGYGSESPCDAYRFYPCVPGRLHIYSRIAYIKHIVGLSACLPGDEADDGWVWFQRESFALAKNNGEGDGGKEVFHQLFRGGLILVGCDGESYAAVMQFAEQGHDARVGAGGVGVVCIVIRYEKVTHPGDILLALAAFGQGIAEEVEYASAYKLMVGIDGMGGKTKGGQSVISGSRKVGNGVEQCAIEVKYNEFLHMMMGLRNYGFTVLQNYGFT